MAPVFSAPEQDSAALFRGVAALFRDCCTLRKDA